MEKQACILSFDIGTTSTKACLYQLGSSIKLLGSAMEEYPIDIRDGGRAEQDPEDWVQALIHSSRQILQKTLIAPGDIAGISFSSQMQGLVLTDQKGMHLRPAMSYMDQRAVKVKAAFRKGFAIDDIGLGALLKTIHITGIAPTSVKDPLWKYLWVKQEEPDIFSRVSYWLDVKDYLIFRLTGRAIATRDSACATALYDNRPGKHRWDRRLCRIYGVNPQHLPHIIESHQVAGELTASMAERLGLKQGTPVFGGGGDASTIGLGAGAVQNQQGHIYMGTSGWISVLISKRKLDIARKIASITCAFPDRYHYFCEQETSGKCLEWVKDHLALDEIDIYLNKISVADDPESVYENLFDYLNQIIRETPPGAQGILFAPWLHGSRSPFEDPLARGMFFNLGLKTGKRDMIRAVVEGLAYNSRWMLESIEKKITCHQVLRFVGGGALSPVTAQIMADITGKELEVPEQPHHAGALGAALIAGFGLGLYSSMEEAARGIPVVQRFRPDAANRLLYDKQYRVFKELYYRNKKLFARMNR